MEPPQAAGIIIQPSSYQFPKAVSQPLARDFVVWSLFSFTTCNCCCLGLLALLFSIKSRDRKVVGDPEGAANYGKTARYLNIAAMTVTIIVFFIVIFILISSALFIINTVVEIMKLPDEVAEVKGN
ncbi:dispanin subfamily A member 2b-like [Candoia aspera]|uniref:dispanin subfamily A member 2b-like n=1 Tax=Candoia aspera TaxID=51853 RepID=UPI002FD820A1